MKKIGIIGLGLIGGSIGRECKSIDGYMVFGYDVSERHMDLGLEYGLVDELLELNQLVKQSDIIVLSTPVDVMEDLLETLLGEISHHQVIIDVGSTKLNLCKKVFHHPLRSQYVACHPLAGTEYSGPGAAIKDLFRGKKNIVCDREQSSEAAINQAINLFEELGMKNFYMNSEEHDRHMAYVSHISHVSSFVLSQTVLKIEKDERQIFNLASTGFASTVRLAKSNPDTWSAIFDRNKDNLVIALEKYIEEMEMFKSHLESGKVDKMKDYIQSANRIKGVLSGLNKHLA